MQLSFDGKRGKVLMQTGAGEGKRACCICKIVPQVA